MNCKKPRYSAIVAFPSADIPEFPIPEHWPRAYGLDIHWNTVAAVWGAHDPQTDVLYLYSEYSEEAEPAIQIAAIRSRGDWIPGLIDPRAKGRNQVDGYRLLKMYRELGLQLGSIENGLESGILNVWQRMHSGRLKVFASLSKYLQERRAYRRDEREQIVTDQDELQDAVRVLVSGIVRMRTKPEQSPPWPVAWALRESLGNGGWTAR